MVDLDIDGKKILKYVLKKQIVKSMNSVHVTHTSVHPFVMLFYK